MKFIRTLIQKFLESTEETPPISPQKLRLCELNAENLFISLEHFEGDDFENLSESQWRKFALPQLRDKQKPLSKLWGLAISIQDIRPDILMLVEVGGKESLDHFNHYFLNDVYDAHFVESNSNRSIDLAFLVRKDLNFKIQTISNRHVPVHIDNYRGSTIPTKFSRDVAEMHVYDGKTLKLILLLTHLKSKISTGIDFQGRDIRRAEASALAAIYSRIREKHKDIGIVVAGDFNANLGSPELELLAQTDLIDFHEVVASPAEDRVSFVHFDRNGNAEPQVLDYILVSPSLREKLVHKESFTYRYKSFYDIARPLPKTMSERYLLPSDHYPLVVTLEI